MQSWKCEALQPMSGELSGAISLIRKRSQAQHIVPEKLVEMFTDYKTVTTARQMVTK